jgi:hypothetical protein
MYTLGRACWIVRKLDSSPRRLSTFEDVLRRSAKVRLSYQFYTNAPLAVKTLLLLLYGAKCYLSLKWATPRDAEIAIFASYPNERVASKHIRRHLQDRDIGELSISTRNCLGPSALLALPACLLAALRLRRLASRLARRLHFMPACRVFSTAAYHLRFRRLLEEHDVSAVFIANHYSPECLALAVAAHRSGRKVIFANHANATWESGYVPPLHSDLAAVNGQAVLDVYTRSSRRQIRAVFIPPASPQSRLRSAVDAKDSLTVGVFLTALTNMERLRDLVESLTQTPRVRRNLTRPHPVGIVNEDQSALCTAGGSVVDVTGTLLSDNAGDCDLAICGNSTAAIEILRGGAPVLYDGSLDHFDHDLNGYLKRGLVPSLPACLDAAALEAVKRFYEAPAWIGVMRNLDASYGRDEAEMFAGLNLAIAETIAARHRVTAPAALHPASTAHAVAAPLKS